MGPDAFDEPPQPQQPTATESSSQRFGIKESPNVPSKPRPDILKPRFGKPKLPETTNKDSSMPSSRDLLPSRSDFRPSVLEKKDREVKREKEKESDKGAAREKDEDMEVKETPDLFLSKHESFRSRINPLLQRSSRLRSSLIFSSSKAEIHSGSLGLKPATEEDEELDTGRTSSIVAQLLEKRRSWSREPFDWRKKTEEKDKEKEKEEKKEEKKEKQQQKEEKEIRLKDEIKEEPQKTDEEVKTTPAVENPEVSTSSSANMNDLASRLQYFNDLAAKRKASKMETETSLKAPEPAEKKPDLSDKPPLDTATASKISTVFNSSAESQPKRPDISAKLAELTRRPSFSSSKPPIITAKPFTSSLKTSETLQPHKEDNASEGQKKDIFKSLKPLPSPKIFKREPLKIKGLNPRRISCGEEILTTDATDAEKTELKKNRSHSSSTLPYEGSKEGLQNFKGSTTSINTVGEGKNEGKTLDFLKKQTQRLKGFLGPKDKKTSSDDRGMSVVKEVTDDSSKKQSSLAKDSASTAADQTTTNHKTSAGTSITARYQPQGSSFVFNSNLRDDTKVILGQIADQKNRHEREETGGDRDGDAREKATESQSTLKRNRRCFLYLVCCWNF
ncbi:protein FAM83H-like [Acanthochromis polyacanthus]|uniref:protein FAM83H-like n=1 Tax=Acanthochromis polyacanthus TaxID=80966 RepID=UPI00223418B3|nr:protein FAM83H-like [Acanthochromis polyacanthus]